MNRTPKLTAVAYRMEAPFDKLIAKQSYKGWYATWGDRWFQAGYGFTGLSNMDPTYFPTPEEAASTAANWLASEYSAITPEQIRARQGGRG